MAAPGGALAAGGLSSALVAEGAADSGAAACSAAAARRGCDWRTCRHRVVNRSAAGCVLHLLEHAPLRLLRPRVVDALRLASGRRRLPEPLELVHHAGHVSGARERHDSRRVDGRSVATLASRRERRDGDPLAGAGRCCAHGEDRGHGQLGPDARPRYARRRGRAHLAQERLRHAQPRGAAPARGPRRREPLPRGPVLSTRTSRSSTRTFSWTCGSCRCSGAGHP